MALCCTRGGHGGLGGVRREQDEAEGRNRSTTPKWAKATRAGAERTRPPGRRQAQRAYEEARQSEALPVRVCSLVAAAAEGEIESAAT